MEKYVVSRELAEKLKAAGYPQNAQYIYIEDELYKDAAPELDMGNDPSIWAVAPLSDELLEQLPITATVRRNKKHWSASLSTTHGSIEHADKPADALAELYLWCRENGYV